MKINCCKYLSVFLLCWICILVHAQQSVGSWREYRAYQNSTLVAETPNYIFSAYYGMQYPDWNYDGSLMSYSKADGEVKLWSKADGLNDVDIQYIGYNEPTKTVVLVYTNKNIDVIREDGTVINIGFLKNDNLIQNINNLEFEGSNAYLSTNIDVVIINLIKTEIIDRCKLGRVSYSFCTYKEYAYVATDAGVFRAPVSSVFSLTSNWEKYAFKYSGNQAFIRKLIVFKDALFFYQLNNSVYYQDDKQNIVPLNTGTVRQLSIQNNQLALVRTSDIWFYTDLTAKNIVQTTAWSIDAEGTSGIYWVASGTTGLMKIKKDDTAAGYSVLVEGVKINSPKRNLNFYMIHDHDKLWIVGGSRWDNRSNYPGTLMVYDKDGGWHNTDENAITNATGLDCKDFTSVAVDPADAGHYFVSSWGEGVYEFQQNQFVKLHNEANSSLQSIFPENLHYVRTSGLRFDGQNNLYVVNDQVANQINIYNLTQKKWSSLFASNLTSIGNVDQLLITKKQKWVNLIRWHFGLFVMENEDASSITKSEFTTAFVDQDGTSLSVANYYPAVEDLQGTIWVGSNIGPLVFNASNQNLDNGFTTCVRPKVPLNDGTNTAYFLLDGQTVTSIVVDGGNRKWIGTKGAGLFLATPNGDGVLANYSVENSMLISNNIICMAMDQETGELFIGTDKGLVSFKTDAIEGKTDYSNVHAFPNPVRPGYAGDIVVTGLIADSNVKITDMNGNLVAEGKSVGGQFSWNGKNTYGESVKTGIYFVLASTSQDTNIQSVVTKIMVIR